MTKLQPDHRQKTAVGVLKTDTTACQRKRSISVNCPMTCPQQSLIVKPVFLDWFLEQKNQSSLLAILLNMLQRCGQLRYFAIETPYFIFIASFESMLTGCLPVQNHHLNILLCNILLHFLLPCLESVERLHMLEFDTLWWTSSSLVFGPETPSTLYARL